MISRPKFSWGRVRVFNWLSSQYTMAGCFAMAISMPGKLPVANSRSTWICPAGLPGRLFGSLSINRVARSWPTAPASFEYAVAKWLCQNSAIFSSSGRCEWIIRNNQR